jgi:hypothetical protein
MKFLKISGGGSGILLVDVMWFPLTVHSILYMCVIAPVVIWLYNMYYTVLTYWAFQRFRFFMSLYSMSCSNRSARHTAGIA